MASQILLKKSTTASAVPTTSDVAVGEVAVNTEDKRLFTQDSGGSVVELGTTPSSLTTSGTVEFGSLSDGTITVTAFADEDDMSSDSATLIPTQQSVKAYVDSQVASKDDLSELTGDTDDIAEGTTNLYFTNERVDDRVNALLQEGSNITLTYDDVANTLTIAAVEDDLSNNDTDDLAEGTTNLYYTDDRVQAVSINSLVEDTTPQLGGTLDANNQIIDMGVNTITDTKVGQWDTAYGWGDHSTAGYLTSFTETNDLSAAVTWANVPDANITESSVTQHEAALTITESQISDLGPYDPAGTAVALAIALG